MEHLRDYYFAHDEMFLIPIEHLSPQGISREFQTVLRDRAAASAEWIDLFNDAFAMYWQRLAELARRAPRYWFPPRLQHVCIVTDPVRVRPYFQPLNKSAWLLYALDFDPTTSNPEFTAYLFLHAERMGLLQEVTHSVVRNLSYWLVRTDEQVADFCDACRRSRRPDASAFRALAEAMPWIRRLHHGSLKPSMLASAAPRVHVPHSGLSMPREFQPQLDALVRHWASAARSAMDAFYSFYARRGRDRAGELTRWLESEAPCVLIAGRQGRILWDPDAPHDVAPVRAALGGIGERAAESIRADLQVIDAHTRRFLGSLRDPQTLPPPHPDTMQSGLSYLHIARKLIAYNVCEAGMERLRVPAPPFERFMLGARTMHEWGHLAAEAGWISVTPTRRQEHADLGAQLAAIFSAIHRDAPPEVRAHTAAELASLAGPRGDVGQALAQIPLNRMPDYQANLLARRYLSFAERETYLRNNVYSLTLESPSTALFQRLARYAYEYQYLRFSAVADPLAYFLHSTWLANEYLERRILSEERLQALFETVRSLCGCYAVDEEKFVTTESATPGSPPMLDP